MRPERALFLRTALNSVTDFIGLSFPLKKGGEGFVAEDLGHDQLAFADGQSDFAIDEVVIERNSSGVAAGVAIEDAAQASPVHGGEAHGARFATGVEVAIVELKGFEAAAGIANGD